MVGFIHHSGFHIESANPRIMIETEEGAGISLQSKALRLSGPGPTNANFDLGGMMEIKTIGDKTRLELGNLQSVHLDQFNIPVQSATSAIQKSRPEMLVTPYQPTSKSSPITPFIELDEQNRRMYIAHQDPRNKRAADPFLDGARLQIAGGFQAGPNHLQLSPNWSMTASPDQHVFSIQTKDAKNVPLIAGSDNMLLGNLNLRAPFSEIQNPGLTVRGGLVAENSVQVTSEIGYKDSAHIITPQHVRAANAVHLTNHLRLENDQVYIGKPPKTVAKNAALVLEKELQIGGHLKLMDKDDVLVVYDTRTDRVVRNIARLVAPPPIMLITSPHPMIQIANVANERILELDLSKFYKPSTADDFNASQRDQGLKYNIIVNPDSMGTIDYEKNVLRVFSKTPTTTTQPLLRTGQLQIRAIGDMGALSQVLVIPFEDRGFVPPLAKPAPDTIQLTEGKEVTLRLHDYFDNPNAKVLSNANRTIDDVRSRAEWTFSVNGGAPTKSALVTVRATNQNTTFRFSIVAVNEFGQPSTPVVVQVKETYIWPPQQTKALIGKITAADEEFATVDLSQYFRDPQGMPLTYRVSTTNPNTKISVEAPSLLRVQAQNRNIEYPLQVIVSNGVKTINGSTQIQMQETYIAPPVISPPTQATSTPLEIGDSSTNQMDLSQRIQDPQQLPLTFSVHANPNNARVSIQGNRLVVQGQDRNTGPYTISIAASNGTKRTVFPVTVQEVIWPTPGLAS